MPQPRVTTLCFSQGSARDNEEAAILYGGLSTIAFFNVRTDRVRARELLADESLELSVAEIPRHIRDHQVEEFLSFLICNELVEVSAAHDLPLFLLTTLLLMT